MSKYYKKHANEFIENTFSADMTEQYYLFEKYLNMGARILDIGFGSGRDSLFFEKNNFVVFSIDPEKKFVKHGKDLGLRHVIKMKAEKIKFENEFDGIWACASLLHISSKKLKKVFNKCDKALKKHGVMYASFKYGNFEGMRNGRFYLDLTENDISRFIEGTKFKIAETCVTKDVRNDRTENWLNIILIKE